MSQQSSYQVAQALATNPYSVNAELAFIESTTQNAVFCYDSTYNRINGIKLLIAQGILRKDISTFSIDKAFKFRFRVSINR